MYSQDSITLLQRSGLDFARHATNGIRPLEFISQLITSGLVLSDEVTWIAFHGGYDFGYLLSLLRNRPMPEDEGEFFEALSTWFPRLIDVKYLARSVDHLSGGLASMSSQLKVTSGPCRVFGVLSVVVSPRCWYVGCTDTFSFFFFLARRLLGWAQHTRPAATAC